jgi:hypothetical protein
MRMKPFGIPTERPAGMVRPSLDKPPAESGPPTVGYAAVLERDPDGLPSRLHLPGPTAAPEVSLFVGRTWAARVYADGRIGLGGDAGDVLGAVVPGSKIIAALDSAGRVLALNASCRPKRRSATPGRMTTRAAADPYRHDPNELLYSGLAGKVLRVT